VILGLILVIIRLAFAAVVAPIVGTRLSRALGTRVEVGDVGFQPLDAIVTLRNVTVHEPGRTVDDSPPIVAKRVRLDLQWLPLLHRTLQVRELSLESARVDLDRFADGSFGLANLERATPATELPEGWSFLLDRVTFRDSQLRVRDHAAGGTDLLEATLRNADIAGLRRQATAFGKANNLRVDALVGGGRLRVHGRYQLREDGLVLDARVRMKDFPLAQASAHVANLGWTEVAGRASGQLRWQREPQRRDRLTGRVILRRASVRTAGLDEPAMRVRRIIADNATVDFRRRRIAVGSLMLDGATLAVDADLTAPIPLIAAVRPQPPPSASSAVSTRAQPVPRWNWMIERLDTTSGSVTVRAPDARMDLRAHASGENIGPDAYWSPLRFEVERDGTAAAFDGTIDLSTGLTIEGRLTAAGIDFPAVARAARLPWADLVQTGGATADLAVQLETTASDGPPLYARGAVTLTDVWIAGPDPSAFAFGAAGIDLTLDGIWPRQRGGAGRTGDPRARIKFSDANLVEPYLLLTRTPDGWILPPFDIAIEPPVDAATGQPAEPPAVQLVEHVTEPPADDSPEIVFAAVRGGGGRLIVVDTVPTPAMTWDVSRVDASARGMSLPAFTFDAVHVRGSEPKFGGFSVVGMRRYGTNYFEASGRGVPLASMAPYLSLAQLPYRFAAGRGSFTAVGSLTRSSWNADVALTLRDPAVIGSDASLQEAIGMSVPSALALLRDPNGEVALQLALAPGLGGSYAERVAAGVRDAILRATEETAPDSGDVISTVVTIQFVPGQATLTPTSVRELTKVADLLRARPMLAVELTADTSAADRRWLAEQALLPQLEPSEGFMGVLRALGMRDARERIRSALAARAGGAPGPLSASDEALLTSLLAERPPADYADQLAALREARLTRAANHLAEEHSITGRRVVVAPTADPRNVAPTVRLQFVEAPEVEQAEYGPPDQTSNFQ
jgi:hypothetical protein